MHKLLYVCLDGLGDDPIPAFDGRTPLEAAETPNLDALARRGRTGRVITVGPGIAPESDIGVFGILGYDPKEEHPGRGVLEAMGIGMDFRDGDLAYRINFATADWPEIVDRRVGRDLTSEEAKALADEVNETLKLPGATFDLRATIEHRGALVIRTDDGQALVSDVTNTDPAYLRQGHLGVALETFEPVVVTATALEDSDAARHAADLTNAFVEGSARILNASEVNERRRADGRLPANLILTRDGGDHHPALQPIADRFGMPWGCFVEMPVERGIALALGMDPVDVPRLDAVGFGSEAEERYAAWAELAGSALDAYQALYIHIKGPDVPAHDGRAEDKRDVITAIDRAFFGVVLPALGPPIRWSPSPPTTPPHACGRRTRPIPFPSWSAAPPSRRTAPSPTANEPANTVPSARGWDPRSCPNSPPRSAAEGPEPAKFRFPASESASRCAPERPWGPNMRCGLRGTRLISSAGERQARSRRIDRAREHPSRSRRGPHQLRRRGRRCRARRRGSVHNRHQKFRNKTSGVHRGRSSGGSSAGTGGRSPASS